MIKFIKYYTTIILVCSSYSANSKQINTLATINNHIITNVDLMIEIKTLEYLNSQKIIKEQMPSILQQMISEKIKELEVIENKIKINELDVEKKLKIIISNKKKETTNFVKKNIKKKIMNKDSWAKLIKIKYSNKLEINLNEIEQKIKNRNLDKEEINKIMLIEKNKKLNIFSKTFYNEIKGKYLIKTF